MLTGLRASGEHGRQIEDLGERGMRQDVVLHVDRSLVVHELVQTLLVIHHEQHGLALVKTFVREVWDDRVRSRRLQTASS